MDTLKKRDDLDLLSGDLDRWFDGMLSGWPALNGALGRRLSMPTVDLQDKGSHYLVKVDAPGMDKKDLKVRVEGMQLVVEGSREEEKQEKQEGYLRSERFSGSFCRVLGLPGQVDGAAAKGEYKDGVLTLTLPKQAPAPEKGKGIPIA